MNTIGIIPARGGSKGLPGKNTRLLCGRPLIAYTIEAALKSRALQRVFVSTDSVDIEQVSRAAGAEVIRHPPELSSDESSTTPVVAWDLAYLEGLGVEADIVVVMRATTPLRSSDDIDAAVILLTMSGISDSVVSVTETYAHPVRLKRILPDGHIENAFSGEGQCPIRRQELEQFFVRNGGLYVARRDVVTPHSLWGQHCLAYVMPPERGVNINTDFDFRVAELLMHARI